MSALDELRAAGLTVIHRNGRLFLSPKHLVTRELLILAAKNKAQIIRRGTELGVDYGLTLSCYDPDASGRPCGSCDSCLLRRRGFARCRRLATMPLTWSNE